MVGCYYHMLHPVGIRTEQGRKWQRHLGNWTGGNKCTDIDQGGQLAHEIDPQHHYRQLSPTGLLCAILRIQ